MTQWDLIYKAAHELMPFNTIFPTILIAVIIILALWERSKLPGKPLTKLARDFGRSINGDIIEDLGEVKIKLKTIEDKQNELEQKSDEKDALQARTRILRFNDEIQNKIRHSEKMFDEALDDCTQYNHYCSLHPDFSNDRTHEAEANIKRVYRECLEQHDFL